MKKKKFFITVFLTLVFFNVSRIIGWRFFFETGLWTRIVNDNFHHWQLGIILAVIALVIKKHMQWFYLLLAVSIGMIIDESMYIFSPLYWRLNHNTWEGIIFEFVVFAILVLLLYPIRTKRFQTDPLGKNITAML